MYRATCSCKKTLDCDFSAMDPDFDRVADALINHHKMVHGKAPKKIGIAWEYYEEAIPKKPETQKAA